MTDPDPRLEEAKAKPIKEIADRLGVVGLKRHGAEFAGPCPSCGGTDRFAINPGRGVYNCRSCGGGDVIGLVQMYYSCDFKAALQWLCGDSPANIDPAEVERRKKRAEKAAKEQKEESDRYRRRAISQAKQIWKPAISAAATKGYLYLRKRGLPVLKMPPSLRFIEDHPYMKSHHKNWCEFHRGPALIAAIQAPNNYLTAVHQTWIDLDNPAGNFKAVIRTPGSAKDKVSAKLVRGSKSGGAIRLITPEGATTMVMGEGIETTLSAYVSRAVPGAAFWAGIDLGHMAGKQTARNSGIPKLNSLDDDGFVPPPWVKQLIFIQDGDSNAKATRAKLEAGLRRAMHRVPGLTGKIVHAGEGVDLNDLLMGVDCG